MHAFLGWVTVGVIAAGALTGCSPYTQTKRVEGYLFTLYTQPNVVKVGEARIGVRIQDREYALLSDVDVDMVLLSPTGTTLNAQAMEPGRGRDFRTRIHLAHAGEYRLVLQATPDQAGHTLTVEYRLRVKK